MDNIAKFFNLPIFNQAVQQSAFQRRAAVNPFNQRLTGDVSDLGLSPGYYRQMANIQRSLDSLKKKQKSDPNNRSLADIIKKKEEKIQQMTKVAETRNQIIIDTVAGFIKTTGSSVFDTAA